MPSAKLTLTSSAVAYNLLTLCRAQVANFPRSPSELIIQLPPSAVEAANAGVTVKIGRPDSITSPTDVTGPETVLEEGDSVRYATGGNSVEAAGKWLKGSGNGVVLYIHGEAS